MLDHLKYLMWLGRPKEAQGIIMGSSYGLVLQWVLPAI